MVLLTDSAPWRKELPQSKGDYNKVADDPADRDYRDKSLRDYTRLLDLPLSNLLVEKVSSAMLMIKVSGKALPFKRMIIGRTPSFGSTKVRSSLKLPTSSLSMGGVQAKPMRALRW